MEVVTMYTFPILTKPNPTPELVRLSWGKRIHAWVETINGVETLLVTPIKLLSRDTNLHTTLQAYSIPEVYRGADLQPGLIEHEGVSKLWPGDDTVTAHRSSIVCAKNGQPVPLWQSGLPYTASISCHPYAVFVGNDLVCINVDTNLSSGDDAVFMRSYHASVQDDTYYLEETFTTASDFLPKKEQWQPQITAAKELSLCRNDECRGHFYLDE